MKEKASTVNFNTILITITLGILGFYGSRMQDGLDKAVESGVKFQQQLLQHDKDIGEIQITVKDIIHRPEYEHFKEAVAQKIGNFDGQFSTISVRTN